MKTINMIFSEKIQSVSKVLLNNDDTTGIIDATLHQNFWMIPESHHLHYNQYYYVVNGVFTICDPLTSTYSTKEESLFITKDTYKNYSFVSDTEYIESLVCSKLNENLTPSDTKNIFYKSFDPIAILHFSLFSKTKKTVVITCEWLCNDKLIWLTSKPFEVLGEKNSFNGLNISKEIPSGKWVCNLYIGQNKIATHQFTVVETQTLHNEGSIFINTTI